MSKSNKNYNQLVQLWEAREGLCYYCNKFTYLRIRKSNKFKGTKNYPSTIKDMATRDHMIPLSRQGEDIFKNMVLSCTDCNVIKGFSTLEEFIQIKADWGCDYKTVLKLDQIALMKRNIFRRLTPKVKPKASFIPNTNKNKYYVKSSMVEPVRLKPRMIED